MSRYLLSLVVSYIRPRFNPVVVRRGVCIITYDPTLQRNAPRSAVLMPKNTIDNRNPHPKKQKKQKREKVQKKDGYDEVLLVDINRLLKRHSQQRDDDEAGQQSDRVSKPALPEPFTEIEVEISEMSSAGDGLALSENGDHVYVVPFTVPGDKALVKVVRHFPALSYSLTDFLKVMESGPQRDDSRIQCQYFGKCSGCQLQMMSHVDQLNFKKRIVEKAYLNFSGLVPELIPEIDMTFPSPRQYGYRTKLTPHFQTPMESNKKRRAKEQKEGERSTRESPIVPPIGFNVKNRRMSMDIEDCPLGTDIVRRGMKRERKRVAENVASYKLGATILLRESTTRVRKEQSESNGTNKNIDQDEDVIRTEFPDYIEEKRCVTDQNATSIEYVDDFIFSNKAGAFFQNNNSILSGFTEFIRQHAHPKNLKPREQPIKYLLDAYSGSGLFTVTLSAIFKSSLGIDIAPESIFSARKNAGANGLSNATGFAAADAATLFMEVPYPPNETLLIIDPPRKGCSDDFLRQLLAYGPRRVVYVSCNVHTQARDVGIMVQGNSDGSCRYDIESIRGFDFFPQTAHVEGVAILNKVSKPAEDTFDI